MQAAPLHGSVVDGHAARDPRATALVAVDVKGGTRRWSWHGLQAASRRVAWHFANHGVGRGDRVAIVLGQRAEAALAHLACSRLGAISMPLSPLFGPDGLAARLGDGAPALVLTDGLKEAVVREGLALAKCAAQVRLVDESGFQALLGKGPALDAAEEERPEPDDPMFLVYTSGTTGRARGALLPHRVVAGRMPGFLLAHEPLAPDAVFYSPADWSWIGGLMDSLFAPWFAGAAVVAHERQGKFDPAATMALLRQHGVTNAFFPPTALKALAAAGVGSAPRLRAVHSAGEPMAPPVRAWALRAMAPVVSEVYGLTEAAFLVGTAARAYLTREGSMGRPYPTHRVELRDEEICVKAGDPTLMLGYWRGPDAAPDLPLDAEGWFHTGDLAEPLDDGSFRYLGRKDDLIKTGGHRVGPAEVEASLLHHPAVAEVAVVGVPDEERGHVIKAFVKLAVGYAPNGALSTELQGFVRARLAAHAYPRVVVFVDELPLTVSGKIRRRALREAEQPSRPSGGAER